MKNNKSFDFFRTIAGRLILVLLVSYILLNTGIAVKENYETNQKIRQLKEDLVKLESEIVFIKSKIAYYQSDSFREMEARRRLGLKKNNENVVFVPQNTAESFIEDDQVKNMAEENKQKQLQSGSFFERASQNALSWWEWILDTGEKF